MVPLPVGGGFWLAATVTVVVALSAFIASGGSRLVPTTEVEVGLMLGGALATAVAAATPPRPGAPQRLHGIWMLVAFALLALMTTLSIAWSLTPGTSLEESSRTLSYLAVACGGWALVRLAPGRWDALLAGLIVSSLAISGWALATKVFPGPFAPDELYARLRPPFDYWNSVGLAAVLGIVPLLWLGARRSGHAAINALAWPAIGLLTVCMMLSYSRGALLAIAVGLALWLAIVPLRLRTFTMLGCVLAVTVPIVAWAFAQDGLTLDGPPLPLREHAGLEFGALLVLLVAALLVAGLAVGFLADHHPPGTRLRARASRVLAMALLLVPVVAVIALANAPGGIGGQVSKAWKQATNPQATGPDNSPSRLTATSSVRSRYWSEALDVHAAYPWLGGGAGAYATLRLRYRTAPLQVQHAHGYVVQTLADLGWIGLAVSLLALLAFLVAAQRALGLRPRDRGVPWDAERVGMAAIVLVVVVFGVHSTIDWTWFAPGNAVPAMLCVGWVAGRGPLRARLQAAQAPLPPEPELRPVAPLVAAAAIALVGLLSAWAAWQPVRSLHAENAAYARLAEGQPAQAQTIAEVAHRRDPLALAPLFDVATMQQAQGNVAGAQQTLARAVKLEPANPEPWRRLGELQLDVEHDAKAALASFQAAYYLDPVNSQSVTDVVLASRAVNGG